MKTNITQIEQQSKVNFQHLAALFDQAFGKNGRIGIIYYLSVLFSDIIFKDSGTRFPILFAYGKQGTGKSTMVHSLMRLFGESQNQIILNNSTSIFRFIDLLSKKRNSLVWLDEYHNNLPNRLINSIKNVYDRNGYERVRKDNSWQKITVRSALVVSGQNMPTKDITLFSRVIQITFSRNMIGNKNRESYRKLINIKQSVLSNTTLDILQLRPLFEANYKETYLATLSELSNMIDKNEIDHRMIMNYAILIATMASLHEELDLPFTLDEFKQQCRELLLDQYSVVENWYKAVN